jgi:hypothetical protein
VASYATFDDVLARAGRFGGIFSVAGKQPDEETIETLLEQVSGDLNAGIAALGHTIPVTGTAAGALIDTAAYGALARALASVPGDDDQDALQAFADRMWLAALAAISGRTHGVILLLEAGAGGASAGSFWEDEPSYDPDVAPETDLIPSLAPAFHKGQTL